VFLVIRDPIAIYLVYAAFKNRWITNWYAISMIVVSVITFFLTLTAGHQNLLVAIYGCRILMVYFPLMFVIGKVLAFEDVIQIGRFFVYTSIVVSVIIAIQYFSPQSALINRNVGGGEGVGFGGVGEYFRPSGIFSFIAVLACFQSVVCAFLLWFILNSKEGKLKYWAYIAVICYIIAMFVSLSRTIIFQTALTLLFVLIISFAQRRYLKKTILISILGVFVVIGLLQFSFFQIAVDNLFLRFNSASNLEGNVVTGTIGERYFGSFYRGLFEPQNLSRVEIPFFGFGQGMGTNAASALMGQERGFMLAEEEWSRVVDESGFLFGWIILFIRVGFSLTVFRKAYSGLVYHKNSLPFLLLAALLPLIINGQWGVAPILGFATLVGGLCLAAIKGEQEPMEDSDEELETELDQPTYTNLHN
jgi:hypothetical protein